MPASLHTTTSAITSTATKARDHSSFGSITGIDSQEVDELKPNADSDWINQRDEAFATFNELGQTEEASKVVFFEDYSSGVKTNRDPWCYNFSRATLSENMKAMITFYNSQVKGFVERYSTESAKDRSALVEEFIENDAKRISWTREIKQDLGRGKRGAFNPNGGRTSMYRPFSKQNLYFDRQFNNCVYQIPRIFPEVTTPNLAIVVCGVGASKDFSALMLDCTPNFHTHDTGQCYPRYLYEPVNESGKLDLGKQDGEVIDGYRRRDAITDRILKTFVEAYGKAVTKEDIFYYVYGVLHSPEYRTRFAADLKKMLPRIPMTKDARDFKRFADAGRQLAEWHLNYETVQPWPLDEVHDKLDLDMEETYKVSKMTFARPTAEQKAMGAKWDKTRVIYNSHVTIAKIPLQAYDYVVNGKPANEWIIERYQVIRDKDSGIVNDPNDWVKEHNASAKSSTCSSAW